MFPAWAKVWSLDSNAIYFNSTLTNFVAWINLNDYGDIITTGNLGAIRVTVSGAEVARAIYADVGLMKIIMPTAPAAGAPVDIYYDNPLASDYAATDPFGSYAVKNPTYDYAKTFWEPTPVSSSFAANDEATGAAANNGTAVNLGSSRNAAGSLVQRWDFTGAVAGTANADRIDLGGSAVDLSGGWPFTLSAWVTVKNSGYTFGLQTIYSDYASFTGQRNFIWGYNAPSGQFRFVNWDASNNINDVYSTTVRSGDPNGTEHHVLFSVDAAGNWAFYVNGSPDGSGTYSVNRHHAGSSAQINIGAVYRSSNWHDLLCEGHLTDLRVSESIALGADWAYAEYNNKQPNFWIDNGWSFNGSPPVSFIGHTVQSFIY